MTKHIALRTALGTWAAAASLLALSASSWAAVVYDVDRTIGAGGVTGFIETDGTTGTLATANIVDWTLTLDDGVGTFDLFGPSSSDNSEVAVFGTAFSATATELLFDFDAAPNELVLFQNPSIGSGGSFYCFGTSGCDVPFPAEVVRPGGTSLLAERSGVVAIGTVQGAGDVPEPASILLLGAGLGGLGLIARRRRKSA